MTALTIRLPNSVHQKIKELAKRDDVSVNQLIASAGNGKMASFMTLDYLKAEAAKGKRSDFEDYLRSAPIAPDASGAVTHTYLLCFQELFAPVSIWLQADLTQKTRQSAYACA